MSTNQDKNRRQREHDHDAGSSKKPNNSADKSQDKKKEDTTAVFPEKNENLHVSASHRLELSNLSNNSIFNPNISNINPDNCDMENNNSTCQIEEFLEMEGEMKNDIVSVKQDGVKDDDDASSGKNERKSPP
jgi:hypothetical protein